MTTPPGRQVSISLSYTRDDDEPSVKGLYGHLTARGFEVWFDRL